MLQICLFVFFFSDLMNDGRCQLDGKQKISIGFRRIGSLATGLQYGHLHTTINLTRIQEMHLNSKNAVAYAFEKISFIHGQDVRQKIQPFMNALHQSFGQSDRSLDIVLSIFDDGLRHKRQVLEFASLFSAGLSIYNRLELNQLSNRVSKIEEEMDQFVEFIEEENTVINELTKAIKLFNTTLHKISNDLSEMSAAINVVAAYSQLHTKIEIHAREMDRWAESMINLLQGRLSPFLVDPKKIMGSLQGMSNKAQKEGLHLLSNEASSIFNTDMSYLVKNHIVEIFIHLPLIEENPIPLYEFLNIPIILENVSPQSPLIFISAENGKNLLAVAEDSRNGIELNTVTLQGCSQTKNHLGVIYLCHNMGLTSKDVTNTCLGTLFTGHFDQNILVSRCNLFLRTIDEFAVQVTNDKFLFFSTFETKLKIKCFQGKSYNESHSLIKGFKEIKLQPKCIATTNNFIFHPQSSINLETNLIYLPKEIIISDEIFPLNSLNEISMDLTKIDQLDLKHIKKLANSKNTKSNTLLYILSTTGLVLACSVIIYLMYLYKTKARPTRAVNDEAIPLN